MSLAEPVPPWQGSPEKSGTPAVLVPLRKKIPKEGRERRSCLVTVSEREEIEAVVLHLDSIASIIRKTKTKLETACLDARLVKTFFTPLIHNKLS